MRIEDVPDVIAERTLTLVEGGGAVRQVLVQLGKPEPSAKADDYHCSVKILGVGDEKAHSIYGIDAFQALQLALRYISFKLHHYRKVSNLELYSWERGDDMGFPLDPQDQV